MKYRISGLLDSDGNHLYSVEKFTDKWNSIAQFNFLDTARNYISSLFEDSNPENLFTVGVIEEYEIPD